MNLARFISVSSAVLLGWLAVTFIHRVPSQTYPRLEKHRSGILTPSASAGAVAEGSEGELGPPVLASPGFFSP